MTLDEEIASAREYLRRLYRKRDQQKLADLPANRYFRELFWAYSAARKEHALLLRCEGLTLKEIGDRLGVSAESARQKIRHQARRMQWATKRTKWRVANEIKND